MKHHTTAGLLILVIFFNFLSSETAIMKTSEVGATLAPFSVVIKFWNVTEPKK